jgi:hypothetical protein
LVLSGDLHGVGGSVYRYVNDHGNTHHLDGDPDCDLDYQVCFHISPFSKYISSQNSLCAEFLWVTGKTSGPSLYHLLKALGKERVMHRIERALGHDVGVALLLGKPAHTEEKNLRPPASRAGGQR